LESQIEHIPLRKQRLLEFLGAQKGPITAKVASIDLDTRASTGPLGAEIPLDLRLAISYFTLGLDQHTLR
jgi:hypothetical protein